MAAPSSERTLSCGQRDETNHADQTAKRPRLPRRDSLDKHRPQPVWIFGNRLAVFAAKPCSASCVCRYPGSPALMCLRSLLTGAWFCPPYRRNAFLSGCRRKGPKGFALARCKPLPPRTQENCRQEKGRQFSCVPVPREGAFRLLPQSRRWAGLQQQLQPASKEAGA